MQVLGSPATLPTPRAVGAGLLAPAHLQRQHLGFRQEPAPPTPARGWGPDPTHSTEGRKPPCLQDTPPCPRAPALWPSPTARRTSLGNCRPRPAQKPPAHDLPPNPGGLRMLPAGLRFVLQCS